LGTAYTYLRMELYFILSAAVCVLVAVVFWKWKHSTPVTVAPSEEYSVDEYAPPPDSTVLAKIPQLSIRAGPRDGEQWTARKKQELDALIKYVGICKASDSDWFTVNPTDASCVKWKGKCWYVFELVKYEFALEFELPVTYPTTPFEIVLPELDGKTVKMYRGGKICLSAHFKPLWAKNVPHFGIAHALSMGLAPWLAAEVPSLLESGKIQDLKKGK